MYQSSQVQSLGPPSGAMTSNLSWWRMPKMAAPPPPIENPITARCASLRLRVEAPASSATTAW
jgi:hypothetical protein